MMKSVGERIRYLRNQKEWSLRELEKRTGINYSVLSRIESGKRAITDEEIKIFSDIFDVSSDFILGRTDNMELTIEEKLDRALQLRDGEKIYFYDMEGLSDDDIEMLKKQIELYREMSEKRKKKNAETKVNRGNFTKG